jgi:hypothetical protein
LEKAFGKNITITIMAQNINFSRPASDMYNINDYTDSDLLKILDLSPEPTDRELEAKIILMIRKYENSDKRLTRFFNEIYEHFFETQEEYQSESDGDVSDGSETNDNGEIEGFDTISKESPMTDEELSKAGWVKKWSADKEQYYYINTKAKPQTTQWTIPTKTIVNDDKAYNEADESKTRSQKEAENYNKSELSKSPGFIKASQKELDAELIPQTVNDSNMQNTRAIEYPSGWLNPLIKETYKRVLYLDSQYRNITYYPNSSSFSINLSDTLIDVLAIRLHSISIPYSWNTISNAPRANQIVLRGNVPGINDGFHDIIITIPAGNYSSPTELITAVNDNITNVLPSTYPDVNFNDTRIELDSNKTFATLYVNITSSYTKSILSFPAPIINMRSMENIHSFLGFKNDEYESSIIISNPEYASTRTKLSDSDIFQVYDDGPNKNNYFTIFNIVDASNIEQIIVTLEFTKSPFQNITSPKQYTRKAFEKSLTAALINNKSLSDTSFIKIETNQTYKMNIELNRNTTRSGHQYIKFPIETGNMFPIWTGPNSCFMFDESEYTRDVLEDPIHNIYSESSPAEMKYVVYTAPYILLNCINKPGHTYRINIPNSPEIGWTQNEYIDIINQSVLQQSSTFDISLNFILKTVSTTDVLYIAIVIYKEFEDGTNITELDYQVEFYDESGIYTDTDGTERTSWDYYLGFVNKIYTLTHPLYNPIDSHYCEIYAERHMRDVEIVVNEDINTFNIKQNNVVSSITLPVGVYTKNMLYTSMNNAFQKNPITRNVTIEPIIKNGQLKTLLRLSVTTTYTTKDYQLIFFDVLYNGSCDKIDTKSIVNTTWDITLGWMLGFRANYAYNMTIKSGTNTFKLRGNTGATTNSVNQAIVVLDDYTQNHMNDGVVTMTGSDTAIAMPSYASPALNRCDPSTGQSIPSFENTSNPNTNLTRSLVYAAQQISQNSQNKLQFYSNPPYITDMFAFVPLKIPSNHGDMIVVDGGTLQDNTRVYFGPVNIRKMHIQLINERGSFIDLNGRNWSFTVICECQYTANKSDKIKMKQINDKK